jgi:3-oxoadipate enol-lactonase
MIVSTVLGPIYVDDQGSASEPVALLWPSLFTDHHMWDHQVPALRAAGWRTLALDPPSHGQSPGPGRGFTMDECATAAIQVLDAAGVQTLIVLFGTSWGGIVAPRIALKAPDRVKGMVLFNTTAEPPNLSAWTTSTMLTWMLAISAIDGFVNNMLLSLQLSAGTRRDKPQIGENIAARFRAWNRRAVIKTVRSVLVDRDGVLDALPHVEAPALIVSGAEDTILPSAMSRRIAAKLPNARHVEVAGAAHLVPLEQPEAANALIVDFLAKLPGR